MDLGRVYVLLHVAKDRFLTLLALNRKGHYGRALEEAIQTHRSQWPRAWAGTNPLSGGRSFNTMSPIERVSYPAIYLPSQH